MMWTLVPDLVAVVACAIAVVTDLRTLRVPNWLTVPALIGGLALSLAAGLLDASVGGAAVGLVVFGVPAALGLVGMGDVKLAIAIGALLRMPLAVPFVLYATLAGGVVALGYLIVRRRGGRMPYALALAIGCGWAIASRHVEALRLL